MPIQIIDNFQLGVEKPIDNRFVIGSSYYYTDKDQIQNRYPGLRIWDADDDLGYIWKDNQWILEAYIGVTSSVVDGTIDYIPKYLSTNVIGDSFMYESGSSLYIGGSVQLEAGHSYYGNGSNITDINADNITSGNLNLARLKGEFNYIIVGRGLGVASEWSNLDEVTVGNSKKINITESIINSDYLLTFSSQGNEQTLHSNSSLYFNPNSGILGSSKLSLTNLDTLANNSTSIVYNLVVDQSSGNIVMKDSGVSIPFGGIIMWNSAALPRGFVLCDGCTYQTHLGTITTPDLKQRFIFGAGNGYNINSPTNLNVGQQANLDTGDGTTNITYKAIYFIMYVGSPIISGPTNCPGTSSG